MSWIEWRRRRWRLLTQAEATGRRRRRGRAEEEAPAAAWGSRSRQGGTLEYVEPRQAQADSGARESRAQGFRGGS
jgi:hypothetical protein